MFVCVFVYLQSRGSELLRCFLNCSFRSLLTPMSWNIRCSLDVYSKPHACCTGTKTNQIQPGCSNGHMSARRCCSVSVCKPDLEFGDHAGLCVVAGAVLMNQTFGQHLGIKLLENIFILDVFEHNHLQENTQKCTQCSISIICCLSALNTNLHYASYVCDHLFGYSIKSKHIRHSFVHKDSLSKSSKSVLKQEINKKNLLRGQYKNMLLL